MQASYSATLFRRASTAFVSVVLFATVLFAATANPVAAQNGGEAVLDPEVVEPDKPVAEQQQAQNREITYNAPSSFSVVAGGSVAIDADSYASDPGFVISCGDATGVDSQKVSVTRSGCSFTVRPSVSAVVGDTTFSTVLSSSRTGSTSVTATFTVTIAALSVVAGWSLVFVAAGYPSEGTPTACANASGADATKITVERNPFSHARGGCTFRVNALSTATVGATSFTSVLTFAGGSRTVTFPINITPASNIIFTAPPGGLSIPAGGFRNFDVSSYATDSDYTISCRFSAASRHSLIASVANTGCDFTVRAGRTAGSATLSVIYNSYSGGGIFPIGELTAVIPITVTSTSALTFTPPSNLAVRIDQTISINARPYATDGANAVSCGTATSATANITVASPVGCSYRVTAGSTTGAASFVVPYTSSSGRTLNGRIDINILGARSDIDFTAPTGLSVPLGGVIRISALDYASDGAFNLSCGTITQSHALIASFNDNGCSITLTMGYVAGTATFTVPYTSTGGDTHDGVFTLLIGDVPTLSATGCTDGTYVDTTANPRVTGANNDLVEDCQALVAAQNLWAGVAANNNLRSIYFIRTWGTGTPAQQKIDSWEGITVTSGRVTAVEIDNTGEEDGLWGTIPTQLGNLTALTTLDISDNRIRGSIPTQIGSLTALTSLDLSDNRFRGSIPTQIGSLTALTSLDLSDNKLTGTIPTQIGSLTALTSLDLSDNHLNGTIPTEIGSLTALTHLYLNSNQLTGSVPTQIGAITTLTTLAICVNLLTGALPTALRTGVTLTDYPVADGYDPIGCQSNFTPPTNLIVARNRTLAINALSHITASSISTVSCGDATGTEPTKFAVTRTTSGDGCTFTVDPVDTLSSGDLGDVTFTVPFTSTDGFTPSGTFTVNIGPDSDIVFAPERVMVEPWDPVRVDLSRYASDGPYDISCSGISRGLQLATRSGTFSSSGCVVSFWLAPASSVNNDLRGNVNVTYTSSGGDTHSGVVNFYAKALHLTSITFTAPNPAPAVTAGQSVIVDASAWAEDFFGYSVFCENATNIDSTRLTSVTRTRDCLYEITAASAATGIATFTVPYYSTGQHARNRPGTLNAVIAVTVNTGSNFVYTAPSGLVVPVSQEDVTAQSITVDASEWAQDGSYDITCADASNVSPNLASVVRNGDTCSFTITSGLTEGAASFTVPYSSSGSTGSGVVSLTIGPASAIVFTAPTGLQVNTGAIRFIDVSAYATDGPYKITCGNPSNSNFNIAINDGNATLFLRDSCVIGVRPNAQGTFNFDVPYTSSGGATTTGTITFTTGGATSVSVTIPSGLTIATGSSVTLDASSFSSNGTCEGAIDVSPLFTSVTRSDIANNPCSYTVTAGNTTGTATFRLVFRSTGQTLHLYTVSYSILPPSYIFFRGPYDLELGINQTLTINALSYASDGGYSLSCGDATDVDTSIITVTRPNPVSSSCGFLVTPVTQGEASFTVTYTSSGGTNRNEVFTIEVGPDSTIAYTAPTGLMLGTNRTRIIDAADYATDGGYLIECGDATNVDSKITVQRTNNIIKPCEFTVTPTGAQGAASFTVPYTSSGGATLDGTINIEIGTTSTIVYTPPPGLTMTASGTITINAATAVTDGSYTITCGQATNRDSKIIRATNTDCEYQITTGAGTGTATFTVPYTSAGGHTLEGQISITVTELPRTTAPALDRQDLICAMLGLEPVRHSTADEITQGDNQAVFCHTPPYIHCQRGANSALTPILRGRSLGQTIQDCYNTIK